MVSGGVWEATGDRSPPSPGNGKREEKSSFLHQEVCVYGNTWNHWYVRALWYVCSLKGPAGRHLRAGGICLQGVKGQCVS